MKIEIKHILKLIALIFCLLPSWTWAASYTVSASTTIVDGDTFCGGSACTSSDTIIIEGGARGDLRFQDFDGNGSYITIQNDTSTRVVMTENYKTLGVLNFDDCKYLDVRGDNKSTFAWTKGCNNDDDCYGIAVTANGTPPAALVWVTGESDHIKLSYMEIYHGSSATGSISNGIRVGDPSLTNAWTFDNFEIHHNYIHDTRYAGMYLGHNRPHYTGSGQECADGCPYTAGFSIHDNLLENLGSYGITYKGVKGSGNSIYNNIVQANNRASGNSTGLVYTGNDIFKHGIGIQYFYSNYYASVYGNRIEKTAGPGLKIGERDHLIYDNEILGCGTGNDTLYGHGIIIFDTYDYMPGDRDDTVQIYDNEIVEAPRYGIYLLSASAKGYTERNIIAEVGLGERYGSGLTEGTLDKANIYEADADDVGFKVWIDDGDYSNDDFTLVMKKPNPPPQIVKKFRINK